MMKRILAITLCIALLCPALFGCAKKDKGDLGAYITMYITDDIYDFDPANAYYNSDAINVLSMMYDTLFTLTDDGKVKKSLVDEYKIVESPETDEYYIEFTLKEAYWSVKDKVSAEDIVFAWKRLVDFRNNYDAASLLFDIKNARAIKEGDVSIDDLGVEAVEDQVVRVSFDGPIDYDQFFLNLTSVATAPLLKRYVSANPDWAKKSSTIATSGPFKLGRTMYVETEDEQTVFDDNKLNENGEIVSSNSNKVKKLSYFYLERNMYYYRDTERDDIDESVTPYRLLVDCSLTPEELLNRYNNGRLFYIGSIPLSLRTGENAEWIKKEAEISNALSTFVCYLNENKLIDDGGNGSYLFANKNVRKALSLAIDRQAIANAVVFAEAATALVPPGVFDQNTKGEFRTSEIASNILAANASLEQAKALLTDITPENYTFTIKAAAYDEIHLAMAEMVKNAWCSLGFNVTVEPMQAIENNDYFEDTDSFPPDVCDDLFIEALQGGKFDAIVMDATAYSADAYSMLSNYAYAFSGSMYSDPMNDIYEYNTHITGYDSVKYNILMEAVYYIPYFANLENSTSTYLKTAKTIQPYVDSANSAIRKLNDALVAAKASYNAANAVVNPTDGSSVKLDNLRKATAALMEEIPAMKIASMQAVKNIVAAELDAALTTAAQNAANTSAEKAITAMSKAEAADAAAKAAKANTINTAIESANTALTALNDAISAMEAAKTAMEAAEKTAKTQTLYEAIQEVYTQNGIQPTTKADKWADQRSTLLHKAEEMLLEDLPVIPIVYNQDAVIVNTKHLSKVSSTYYAPAYFRKTKLKNYTKYTYYDPATEKNESIFKDFPEVPEELWAQVK